MDHMVCKPIHLHRDIQLLEVSTSLQPARPFQHTLLQIFSVAPDPFSFFPIGLISPPRRLQHDEKLMVSVAIKVLIMRGIITFLLLFMISNDGGYDIKVILEPLHLLGDALRYRAAVAATRPSWFRVLVFGLRE